MIRRILPAIALSGLLLSFLTTGCATRGTRLETSAPPAPPVVEPAAADSAGAAEAVENLDAEPFREDVLEVQGTDEALEAGLDAAAWNERGVLATVHFGFDSARLTDAALATLEANARWLREHPRFRVIVEGHCDERGTTEYNLNLGARRARAIRDHLVRLGIDAERIETISYGEERPVDPGHGEAAWAKNRRGEFRLVNP